MKIKEGRIYKNIISSKEVTVYSIHDNGKVITVNNKEIPKKESYGIEYFQKLFVPLNIEIDDDIIVTYMGRIIKVEKIRSENIRNDSLLCIDNTYLSRFIESDFSLKQVGFSPSSCEYRFIYDEKVEELGQKTKVINKLYKMRDFIEEKINVLEKDHFISLEEVRKDIKNFMNNEERGH
jgi:hypothetical protein